MQHQANWGNQILIMHYRQNGIITQKLSYPTTVKNQHPDANVCSDSTTSCSGCFAAVSEQTTFLCFTFRFSKQIVSCIYLPHYAESWISLRALPKRDMQFTPIRLKNLQQWIRLKIFKAVSLASGEDLSIPQKMTDHWNLLCISYFRIIFAWQRSVRNLVIAFLLHSLPTFANWTNKFQEFPP